MIDQLAEVTDRIAEGIHKKMLPHLHRFANAQRVTTYVVSSANGKTDSSGNLDLPIYPNTSGKHVVIGRVLLWADGYNPGTPFSGGWLTLYIGAGFNPLDVFDMLPVASGGQLLPNVVSYSGHNAIRLRTNDTLSLHIVGGPTSTNVSGTVYGFLEPTDSDFDL